MPSLLRASQAPSLALTTLLSPCVCSAQSPGPKADARDLVKLSSGEELRGRVVQRYEPDFLVLDQAGKARRVPVAQVVRVHTVADAVAEFLDMRREGLAVSADWSLAETVHSQELHAIARLQAYHVLLRDPEHEGAHAMLGHTGGPGKWRWRFDGEPVSAATFAKRASGERFTLHSEHFALESRSGLRCAVDTLFDLERTYAAFWRELGTDLRPRSLFQRIEVKLSPSHHDFPKISGTVGEPYCDPSQRGGGVIYTFREVTMPRAARLAAVTVEELLYRAVLGQRAVLPATQQQRIAAWIEVGLGRYFDSRSTGNSGYLAFGPVQFDPLLSERTLGYRPFGLEDFIQVPYLSYHDDPAVVPFLVSHAATLVAWLLDEKATAGKPPVAVRPRFLAYVRACYRDGKGNSSSELDAALGKEIGRVENLEQPWIAWLAKTTGQPALRKPHTLRPTRSLRDRVLGPLIR